MTVLTMYKGSQFRELSSLELTFVNGGSETVGNPITVTGNRTDDGWVSVTAEDLALVGIFNLGDGFIADLFPGGGVGGSDPMEDTSNPKEFLQNLLEKILQKLFPVDFIKPQNENTLSSEFNPTNAIRGTITTDDGRAINTWTTPDGVTYYDRNGNGKADLKSQFGPTGQLFVNDGTGWRGL